MFKSSLNYIDKLKFMLLDKNLEEDIKNLVKKLVIFIEGSSMSDEIKNSWISLVPEMSFEQIVRLYDILEAKYLDEKTQSINEQLKKDLSEMVLEFDQKDKKLDEEFLVKINKLENEINAGNK